MTARIHYTNCPVCNSTNIAELFKAKDHTATGEVFSIWECKSCTLRFTQDIPYADAMTPYYRSDNYISHSNTSKGLINSMYQWVRNRTLRQKRKLVQRSTGLGTGVLLDVGSGIGSFANEMNRSGWKVTALEPDETARQKAREVYGLNISDTSDFYKLPEGNYDAITLWHVLEHVHELHRYIQQLKILLKPNGCLMIAVPNYTSKDADIYKEYWAAYDVPRHLYHFSPAAMKELVEKHGLKIAEYKPMWYDSFYISMLSSKYKNGTMKLVSSFLNGLRSNSKAVANKKFCSSVIYIIKQAN